MGVNISVAVDGWQDPTVSDRGADGDGLDTGSGNALDGSEDMIGAAL